MSEICGASVLDDRRIKAMVEHLENWPRNLDPAQEVRPYRKVVREGVERLDLFYIGFENYLRTSKAGGTMTPLKRRAQGRNIRQWLNRK
jgi:hypothetical protein